MKTYNLLIEYSNYLKQNNQDISVMLSLYKKLKPIKNTPEYLDYFQLLDMNQYDYYFYSPVASYKTISNIYISDSFDNLITKEKCEKILQNEDIKLFVDQSEKVNAIIIKKIGEIFSRDYKQSSIENYYCNSIINELGKANILTSISTIVNNSEYVSKYIVNREKTRQSGLIKLISTGFVEEHIKSKVDVSIINAVESINLIYSLIMKIFYDAIFEKIVYLRKKDITIISSKTENRLKIIEFESKNLSLIIHESYTIVVDGNVYFPYSSVKNLIPEFKANYKCFTLNIVNDTFTNFSILSFMKLLSK